MSSKFSKLVRKWSCFGGKTPSLEDEVQNRLRMNKPTIVITECRSVGTSPTFSRQSSSASSQSSQSDEEVEAEIFLRTDEVEHKMGMDILIRTKTLDERDCGGETESVSLIRVLNVEIGSFAHGFGVRKGDFITKVNGQQCSKDSSDIKDAFMSYSSDQLEMEILRNVKNRETGKSELHKMTICNARRIGGVTEEEVEIIHITGSSWSLSNIGTYYRTGEQRALLQFECEEPQWAVKSGNRLGLVTDVSEDKVMTNAIFRIHEYWNHDSDVHEIPVVLQHQASGLCVSLVGNNIKLVEENELEYVTDETIIFNKKIPSDSFGPQVTFQSAFNSSYIGFKTQGRTPNGYAVPIIIGNRSEDNERNITFLQTDI